MQPRHFENLANLERQVIKQQFQKVVNPPTLPFGPEPLRDKTRKVGEQKPKEQKLGPDGKPQRVALATVTGDRKLAFPYTDEKTRVYPRQSEADTREQRGKLAALAANDGLTPAGGGLQGMMNEMAALRPMPKRLRMTTKKVSSKRQLRGTPTC